MEEPVEAVRRAWAAFDAADPDAFRAAVAPTWCERKGDGSTARLEDALAALARYRDEFTDTRTVIDQVVADHDLVAVRTTTRATHRASGRTSTRYEIAIHRVENGRVAETWSEGGTPAFEQDLRKPQGPGSASGSH